MATTFSPSEAEEINGRLGTAVQTYLSGIPDSQWLNLAWLNEEMLPPRFGITSSNTAESLNSMFDEAREINWKSALHLMLSKMFQQIGNRASECEGKEGVVRSVHTILLGFWEEKCAGYTLFRMGSDPEEKKYMVFEPRENAHQDVRSFNLNVNEKSCDCGIWQCNGYPCEHACAYYKLCKEDGVFQDVLDVVSPYHTYEYEQLLHSNNFYMVCLDRIVADRTTRPPIFNTTKKAGRPKKKRIRKRSRFADMPHRSNVKCRLCGLPGHNARTCPSKEDIPNGETMDLS